MSPKRTLSNKHSSSNPDQKGKILSTKTPFWKAMTLCVASVVVFSLLLELGLAVFGVKPVLKSEDPFVGFSANMPLFVPGTEPENSQYMVRAENKRNFFNQQRFLRDKPSNSFRIFTLGGSTTYGRPYNDTTSFSGWLRELLPALDANRQWEVINAGGISYASYRVANLMEELINYQPDLFIIYTGHNEFLEERTYGQVREMSPIIKTAASVLAKTRTWSAMKSSLQKLGVTPDETSGTRDKLSANVDAILDRSAGLERYTRDDTLQEKILRHYRISLERMIALAQTVDAQVILVSPASNLKNSSPFKSEPTQGLSQDVLKEVAGLKNRAEQSLAQKNWQVALDALNDAVNLDPRNADLLYLRGHALLQAGDNREARIAFLEARDEDVCPLRALSQIHDIVAQVADENKVMYVDYVDLVENRTLQQLGHRIPGEDLFLDHVHPTIEGHKLLAVALLESLAKRGIVALKEQTLAQALRGAEQVIDARVDHVVHGQALANLARVIYWAGKLEDADRLARKAIETAGDDRQVFVDASSIIASVYYRNDRFAEALNEMYQTLERAPGAMEIRLKMGQILAANPFNEFEKSAANVLLVSQQMPFLDTPFATFGEVMFKRGRLDIAYLSVQEALRLSPKNNQAQKVLSQIRRMMGDSSPEVKKLDVLLDLYPSRAPRQLVQVMIDKTGRQIPHGIEVEFYENGRLKHFIDMDYGKPSGLDMSWDETGNLVSIVKYRYGERVD